MKRFLVTEEEKRNILNLYKKNVIKESSSCMCPDGTKNPSCCGGSQTINLGSMSEEDKQKALAMANSIISQNKAINQSNIDKETKAEIDKLTSEISKLITSLNTANNRPTRKAIKDQLDIYNKRIENLKGGSDGSSNRDPNQTLDQKISAWTRVAGGLISLISSIFFLKTRLGSSSPSNGGDDGGVG